METIKNEHFELTKTIMCQKWHLYYEVYFKGSTKPIANRDVSFDSEQEMEDFWKSHGEEDKECFYLRRGHQYFYEPKTVKINPKEVEPDLVKMVQELGYKVIKEEK